MKPALVSVKSDVPALRQVPPTSSRPQNPSIRLRHAFGPARKCPAPVSRWRRFRFPLPSSIMCSNHLGDGTTIAFLVSAVPRPPVEAYMKTSTRAWSLLAGLALMATPLHAQRVSAEVVVRGGPAAGRVAVDHGYSSDRRPVRRVVVERHAPRIVRVERFRHRHWKQWKRHGYREVVVYYVDGRYYDQTGWGRHPGWGRHRGYQVVVYERDGRFYSAE